MRVMPSQPPALTQSWWDARHAAGHGCPDRSPDLSLAAAWKTRRRSRRNCR